MPRYNVFIESKAKKQFKKIPKDQQTRILTALNTLETEGLSNKLDIKKLQGYRYHYRIRIGKLVRIRFELSADRTIIVYSISTREKAYK
ncbi:MAG: type II toxin-antitoxin system RelE/ParE family toxin [Candidatus Bathyarchaeota archaeon]|nr:type II toxin-antitoxin system RelE/ParE family toxin [Candidatus Bathyarchaeota archaeon]